MARSQPTTAKVDHDRVRSDRCRREGIVYCRAWRPAKSGDRLGVEDPATGETLCEIADAGEADALDALAAAHDAQAEWGVHPPRERGEILRRAFELIAARTEQLATLMSLEMGKSLVEARGEVTYANDFLRWFSEEAVRIRGSFSVSPNGKARLLTMRQPVGPCLLITPWNFPLAMGTRKIGPAIAAGCTMVVKPAKQTPLSMLALAQIFEEAGLPAGVLNVVTTSQPARSPTRCLMTRGCASCRSPARPRWAARSKRAMDGMLRVSMELGGNAPLIVFDDADLELAVDQAMMAKLRNMGEACTSANRMYVQARGGRGVLAPDGGADGAVAARPRHRARHRCRSADRRDAARQGA